MVKVAAVAWYLECDCGQPLENPLATGSMTWASGDTLPDRVTCAVCGKSHKVPDRIK